MAMSNAEKQRRYRNNRVKTGGLCEYRINTFVSSGCYFALDRLSRYYSITKRQALELLIKISDEAIINNLEIDTDEWNKYFNIKEGD